MRKTYFLKEIIGSSSIIYTRYRLEVLHKCGRKVETKSQKVLVANSYVFRS